MRPPLAAADAAAAAPGGGARSAAAMASQLAERGRALLPGLLLAGGVGLAAYLVAKRAFPYALAIGYEVPIAMAIGLVVANVGGVSARSEPGVRFAAKFVLGLGVALLGLRLNLQLMAGIGSSALWLVLGAQAAALGFAVLVSRRIGVESRIAVLIGIGSAVCGNSAIAATAPVVRADAREMSFAAATITILGTLAVFLFPLVGHLLDLDVVTFGLWAGTSVPDTAQTVATSAAFDTVGRDVAVVVKLLRTVLLAPMLLLIVWQFGRAKGEIGVSKNAARRGIRRAVPFFVVGFIALAIARTMGWVDGEAALGLEPLTRGCFLVALAGLGLQTRFATMRTLGLRPFLVGVGTFAVVAAGSLSAILAFGIETARTQVTGGVDPRPLGAFTLVQRGRGAEPAGGNGVGTPSGGAAAARRLALRGRVVATGIPDAGALSPVGSFHPGGPMHDDDDFAATTRQGEILDPSRLLVASGSNFGAPRARADWAPGSILSVATDRHRVIRVPRRFAASGAQASAHGGAAQLYSAQSPAFLNRIPHPGAATADMPAVSNPLGISVNNAFGRPWFGSAPKPGLGAETVLDPDGRPLSEAPSARAGGVFAGAMTNRDPQLQPGDLRSGVVANAFLGASPDASGRAVFAVATADGALAQVHVGAGVDGLAPRGTIDPLIRANRRARVPQRVGMLFNWVPDRFLYVTDPRDDALVKLHLDDDFETFQVTDVRRLHASWLRDPVDLAPAVSEVANPSFSSNTTLAGEADLYVANRGSGTIVRLRQDGRARAIARARVPGLGPLGPGVIAGIATSPDARTIWLSLDGRRAARAGLDGAVVAIPAFGAPR